MLFLSVLSAKSLAAESILPPYLPALRSGERSRNLLIQEYFNLGFGYTEILAFLCIVHGIRLSLRHLKRILCRIGLRRRGTSSNLHDVVSAVEQELSHSGSLVGYRQMHQRITLDYGMIVNRETIRRILVVLDPNGVRERTRHKLRRRQYLSKGPNYIWHIDGYDKLKPFGFCIHGAIDGYSRRNLWLEVGSSNNDPRIIATFYHDCVKQLGGAPHICRADAGTENVHIAGMQRFLRRHARDEFGGGKSFLYGRSVANQRIEAWWAFLLKSETDWWINYFKDLRDQGLYDGTDPVHAECLRFCFLPLLREELERVTKHWNLHKIRPSSNETSPHGRPDTIYFLPEATNTISYLHKTSNVDLVVTKDVCCEVEQDNFSQTFAKLAHLIMRENNLQIPSDVSQAEHLYIDLLGFIEDLY